MAYASPYGGPGLWAVGVAVAALTAFYMFRQVYMTFFGEPHWQKHVATTSTATRRTRSTTPRAGTTTSRTSRRGR